MKAYGIYAVSSPQPVSAKKPCPACGASKRCIASPDGSTALCYWPDRVHPGVSGRRFRDKNGDEFLAVHSQHPVRQRRLRSDAGFPRTPSTAAPADHLNDVYTAFLKVLTLSSGHEADLRRRGLSDSEVQLRGYRSLSYGRHEIAARLLDQFGPAACAAVPGIVIKDSRPWITGAVGLVVPVRDVAGRIVALKVRSDRLEAHGKYSSVSSRRYGGPGPGAPVHVPLYAGSTPEVVRVTEGELKGDVATALSGIRTIAVPGVTVWRPVLPIIEALQPKRVLIAYDADYQTNPNVRRALGQVAEAVAARGYRVEIETWS